LVGEEGIEEISTSSIVTICEKEVALLAAKEAAREGE